jgi:hypothetical protein
MNDRILFMGTYLMLSAFCAAQDMPRPPANTLSDAEKAERYELLFDGKSFSAFDPTSDQAKVWRVRDGAIKSDSSKGAGRLKTKEEFTNFVLKAEFMADPHVHAHVWLRSGKTGGGYELQLKDHDPKNTSAGSITGSITNVGHAPAGTTILPGVWNALEVTMDGTHLVVIYNGKKTVDVNNSRSSTGFVSLDLATPEDAPGENIAFRSLKIKRLP